jgi:methyltransferase-like protein 23
MEIVSAIESFVIGNDTIEIYVPTMDSVKQVYEQQKEKNAGSPFPYWAKVWPSALALCEFLTAHSSFIKNKQVLELAAGVGLPGFIAARYAKTVCISDYSPDALELLIKTVHHLQVSNVTCRLLDLHHLPADTNADIILLSDINYAPENFEKFYEVIECFLQSGSTIIISTPQRLMAKPFVERLLPFCIQYEEISVSITSYIITIMVLQKKKL